MDNLARKNSDGKETLLFDLSQTTVRDMNQFLHHNLDKSNVSNIRIIHPDGAHSIAVGLEVPVNIEIEGHAGYFCAGMNKQANVTIKGNVGWSVAENIMSGMVRVKGYASECAGASGHGGTLIIERDASLRCGISMKGVDIIVGGSVGNFSAFMAQAGHLVVCGDAGDGLGDSIYEAIIYVRGKIKSLGADARIEPLTDEDHKVLAKLLALAGFKHDTKEFKRVASARQLYHWNADANQEY
ncbi:MAG: protein glxC [Pseudomonadota bacterium]|nr:protein glxC [Pseudomonadota bacterium]